MGDRRLAFASDFDGTLYFMRENKRMRDQDLAAVREFQANGGLFGVCSGRSLVGIDYSLACDAIGFDGSFSSSPREWPQFRDGAGRLDKARLAELSQGLVGFDFYILASGALILDSDRRPLHVERVPQWVAHDLYRSFENRCGVVIQANDTVYSFGESLPMQEHIDSVDELGEDVYGISLGTGSVELARSYAAEINERFGEFVCAYENVRNVDVAPCGCSKGAAVEHVRRMLGIDSLGAIGDSYNDLPMLSAADRSYTFESSPEPVRMRVSKVVGCVAEALVDFGQHR